MAIPEEKDYWVRPGEILLFCQNKNIILPQPFLDFIFTESFRRGMAHMSLKFAKEAYEDAILQHIGIFFFAKRV